MTSHQFVPSKYIKYFKDDQVKSGEKMSSMIKTYYICFDKVYIELIKKVKKEGFTDKQINKHPMIMACAMSGYMKNHPDCIF